MCWKQVCVLCWEAPRSHGGTVCFLRRTTLKMIKKYSIPILLQDHFWLIVCNNQGKGTRKHVLTRIMVSRSEIDMKRIKEEYKKNYGKTLYKDILVSKHLTNNKSNRPQQTYLMYQDCFMFSSFLLRMTLKEIMRRFCLLYVGVTTKGQSLWSKLIQLRVQQWKPNLLTHIVPNALVKNWQKMLTSISKD